MIYIAAVIAVIAAIWATLERIRIYVRVATVDNRLNTQDEQIASLKGKVYASERHDRDAIRDHVDTYLQTLDLEPGGGGDMLQLFQMMQMMNPAAHGPHSVETPEPVRERPGMFGEGGVDRNGHMK